MLRTTLLPVPISCPVISVSLNPSRSTLLASDLQQTVKWRKVSLPGYRQLTLIPFMPRYKALVSLQDKCLNVNSDYFVLWCVPPTCPLYIKIRVNFLASECFLSQFFKLLYIYKGQNLRLKPEENSSMNCLLLNILCGTILASYLTRYMA
jgi:hypothetical protein